MAELIQSLADGGAGDAVTAAEFLDAHLAGRWQGAAQDVLAQRGVDHAGTVADRDADPSWGVELKDREAGVGIGDVHDAVAVDADIAGLGDEDGARARVDQLRRVPGHAIADFFRLKRVGDVEDAHAGIVPGGEDRGLTLEQAGPVFVQIVRAEFAAAGTIVGLGWLGEGGEADRVGGIADVEEPGMGVAGGAVGAGGFVREDAEVAAGKRQGRVGAAGKGWREQPVVEKFRGDGSVRSWMVKPPSRQAP